MQLESIIRHGNSLLAAFPSALEKDPLALCKKLRRIEATASHIGRALCGDPCYTYERAEKDSRNALARVRKLLGLSEAKAEEVGLFVNTDPRGYALKLDDAWTRGYNAKAELRIHSDWGGYGILAPEIND